MENVYPMRDPRRQPIRAVVVRTIPPPLSAEAVAARWPGWLAEQIWLWPEITDTAVQAHMLATVDDALEHAMPPGVDAVGLDLLHQLKQDRRHAARLRLGARLLRSPRWADETPVSRDLTACCLMLAAMGYNDILGVMEFSAMAERRAIMMDREFGSRSMPPGLGTASQLSRAMPRQGRRVLGYRFTLPSPDSVVGALARAAAADPLADYLGYASLLPGGHLVLPVVAMPGPS